MKTLSTLTLTLLTSMVAQASYPIDRISYRETYVKDGWKVFENPKVVVNKLPYRIMQDSDMKTVCEMLAPGSQQAKFDLDVKGTQWSADVNRAYRFDAEQSRIFVSRILCR